MNSTKLVEHVEFRATSPRRPLPGLDEATRKLEALNAAIKRVQGSLGGISANTAFKLNAKQFEAMARQVGAAKGAVGTKRLAKLLGFPDERDIMAFAQQTEKGIQDAIGKLQRRLDRSMERVNGRMVSTLGTRAQATIRKQIEALQSQSLFMDPSASRLKNPRAAGKFFESYAAEALKDRKKGEAALAAILSGMQSAPAPVLVPPSLVPPPMPPPSYGAGSGGGGGGRKSGGPALPADLPPPSGPMLEEKVDSRGKVQKVRRRYLESFGKTIDEFWEDTNQIGTVTTTSALKKAKAKFDRQMAAIKRELDEQMAQPENRRDYARVSKLREQAAASASALTEGKPGAELERLGLGGLGDRARGFAANQLKQAGKDADRAQQAMVADAKRVFTLRKELDAARARGEREEAKRLATEKAHLERQIKGRNALLKARAKSQAQADKEAEKVRQLDLKRTQERQYRDATYAGVAAGRSSFLAGGGQVVSTTRDTQGRVTGEVLSREQNGMVQTLTLSYERLGASAKLTTKALRDLRQEEEILSGDFMKNTIKVTAWAASVAALYGTLNLLKQGMAATIQVGAQMARLDQVFSGVGGTTQELTYDLMHLATMQGRSTQEAMEAGIAWSRLGLTKAEANQAVRLSLMAANVAELTAIEATDKLQGIMQNYNLRVSDLATVLGELNQISNTYNVTNKDLLEGISRTAAAAKQAGLPLQELTGLIGAMVGATKQSGANVGNALKSVIMSLSNPDLQDKLRMQYRFESTTGGEGLKSMSQLLADLYVRYQKLNNLERQSMLFSIAGKTQANRLAALLDNYVVGQTMAINSQLHLNSAQEENAKILATLKAQLTAVTSEWEKFVMVQMSRGPSTVLLETTKGLRNVLALMNTPMGSAITTGFMGLFAAAGAKTLLSGLTLRQGGFVGRTKAQIVGAMAALNGVVNSGIQDFITRRNPPVTYKLFKDGAWVQKTLPMAKSLGIIDKLVLKTNNLAEAYLRVAKSANVSSVAVRALFGSMGVGLKVLLSATTLLWEFLWPMLAIGVAVKGFNMVMDSIEGHSTRAEEALAGFNAEAERAHSAAEAYAMSAKLLDTIGKTLTPDRGLVQPATAKQIISQASEVAFADEPDTTKQRQKNEAFRKQLQTLYEQRKVSEVLALIDKRRTELIKARQTELQKEYVALKAQQRADEEAVAEVDAADRTWGKIGANKRKKTRDELSSRMNERRQKTVQLIVEQEEGLNDALERRLQYDERHLAMIERERLAMEGIAEIYNSIQPNNPYEKAILGISKLKAMEAAIAKRREQLNVENKQDITGQVAVQEVVKKLNAEEDSLRDRLMKLGEEKKRLENGRQPYGWGAQAEIVERQQRLKVIGEDEKRTQDRIEAVRRQKESAQTGALSGQAGLGMVSRNKQLSGMDADQKRIGAERRALEELLEASRKQAQFGFGQQRVGRMMNAADYGYNETERIARQIEAMEKRKAELDRKAAAAKASKQNPGLTEAERAEQIQIVLSLEQKHIELLNRHYQIQREINQLVIDNNKEMMRSFFTAGPAEMLRKLSAFRLAFGPNGQQKRGLSQGAFFGLSPGLRQDYGMFNPNYDASMIFLKQEQARLKEMLKNTVPGGVRPDGSVNSQGVEDKLLTFTEQLVKSLQGLDTQLADNFTALKLGADVFNSAVDKFSSVVDKLAAIDWANSYGQSPAPAGGVPRLPQAGGVGGGKGYI